MSHCIDTMAYTGQKPWHDLGQVLEPKQPIRVWRKAAGMDWQIKESSVHFCIDNGDANSHTMFNTFAEQKVLYRSDTQTPLSVVSNRYQVVQPSEVLEFYRDLTEASGYELETAGVLKGGRKFWALAKTGQSQTLKGNDVVNGYLLLATSCDGSLATVATPTTVRVVCNNTLAIAVNGAVGSVKVGHRSKFDADKIKQQLGIAVSQWDRFMYDIKHLSERKVNTQEVKQFLHHVFNDSTDYSLPVLGQNDIKMANEKAMNKALTLFNGHGRGAELTAAKDTAWGLLCSITEYVDHEKQARSNGNRLDSAWFGQGATIKQKAFNQALQLVS